MRHPIPVGFLALLIASAGAHAQQAMSGACADPVAAGSPLSRQVVGAWRHTELTRYAGDVKLSSQPFDGENVLKLECDMTWSLKGPEFESSGTYRWVAPDRLEQRILESKLPAQKGQAGIKRIVVDARKLEMHVDISQSDLMRNGMPLKMGQAQDTVHIVSTFSKLR